MQIEIFDVGHGHCTVITAPNGRRMMLDCGQRWDDRTFWTRDQHEEYSATALWSEGPSSSWR